MINWNCFEYNHGFNVEPDYRSLMIPQNFRDNSDSDLIGELNLIQNENLREILPNYSNIFAKYKYDVGKINIVSQRVLLKSGPTISLWPYRTSHLEEK